MEYILFRLDALRIKSEISKIARLIIFTLTIFITVETAIILGRYNFDKDKYNSLINDCYTIKTYIINTSSKRIHIDTCGTADRMSDKNRKNVKDTIANLVSNGYVVCGNCGAGIKSRNLINDDGTLSYVDIKTYEVGDLPTVVEYLEGVDVIGEWYTKHIPTYQSSLSSELLSVEFKSGADIKTYKIGFKQYNVVSNNVDAIFNDDPQTEILRASEDAILNYKNVKSRIMYRPSWFYKKTSYYPCEYIVESADDYDKAGDDCVRFFFTIMNSIKPDFTFHLGNMLKSSWNNIQARDLCKNTSLVPDAMYKLGFDVYDIDPIYRDVDNDGNVDYEIKGINQDFKLQKGDIILRPGHLHIYMGIGYNPAKNFGWGRVYREYPRYYSFINDRNTIGRSSITILEEMNDEYKYTRVYRYRGVLK